MMEIGYGQEAALRGLLGGWSEVGSWFPTCRESREWF